MRDVLKTLNLYLINITLYMLAWYRSLCCVGHHKPFINIIIFSQPEPPSEGLKQILRQNTLFIAHFQVYPNYFRGIDRFRFYMKFIT